MDATASRAAVITRDELDAILAERKAAEDRRADSRNNWRLVMLVQTILIWIVTVKVLSKVAPGMELYAPAVPLILDTIVTGFNKIRKV